MDLLTASHQQNIPNAARILKRPIGVTDFKATAIKRIVNDIDEIIKVVRFFGWHGKVPCQKQVEAALHKTVRNTSSTKNKTSSTGRTGISGSIIDF
jgi:hypothetical protein